MWRTQVTSGYCEKSDVAKFDVDHISGSTVADTKK
jgi:hypothetical protein